MSEGKRRWPHAQAWIVAQELKQFVAPACQRIEIAGSLRRNKADVGDIELLCVPKPGEARPKQSGLFDGPEMEAPKEDALSALLREMCDAFGKGVRSPIRMRKNAKGLTTFGPLNKLLVHLPSGIPVDIFTATEANWGMALVVRTGPAEFNVRLMSQFRARGMQGHAYGGVTEGMHTHACPTEEDVFRLAGWRYLRPEERR